MATCGNENDLRAIWTSRLNNSFVIPSARTELNSVVVEHFLTCLDVIRSPRFPHSLVGVGRRRPRVQEREGNGSLW